MTYTLNVASSRNKSRITKLFTNVLIPMSHRTFATTLGKTIKDPTKCFFPVASSFHQQEFVTVPYEVLENGYGRNAKLYDGCGAKSNDFYKFVKDNFLVVDESAPAYMGQRAGSYKLNIGKICEFFTGTAYEHFLIQLTPTPAAVAARVSLDFNEELTNGTFIYNEPSGAKGRRTHYVQNIKSEIRSAVLLNFGYVHNYDVDAAYQTGVVYKCRQMLSSGVLNAEQTAKIENVIKTILHYVENKRAYRRSIAEAGKLTIEGAKALVTAMFNGADMNIKSPEQSFYAIMKEHSTVEDDVETWFDDVVCSRMAAVMKHDWMVALYEAQSTFWEIMFALGALPKNNSKSRAAVYFEFERSVLDEVVKFIDCGNRTMLIHDGWVTENPLNIDELEQHLLNVFGTEIAISYDRLDGVEVAPRIKTTEKESDMTHHNSQEYRARRAAEKEAADNAAQARFKALIAKQQPIHEVVETRTVEEMMAVAKAMLPKKQLTLSEEMAIACAKFDRQKA